MKKIFLLTATCIASLCSYSQSFMHGVGLIVYADKVPNRNAQSTVGFTYSPRLNFLEHQNTSLSVGIPLGVAIGGSYEGHFGNNYSYQSGSLRFVFNAPVLLNFNYGKGATRNADKRFGFFAGAGYGFHYSNQNDFYHDDDINNVRFLSEDQTTGPVANAGMRIGVGRRTHNIEIKFSYMKGVGNYRPDIYGFGTLFNF